jgi:AcrR family transcriptional regulator
MCDALSISVSRYIRRMPARSLHRQQHRRRRADTEQRILEVAADLLTVRRFNDLCVDDVTSRMTISRTAFYRYFPDLHAVLIRLLGDVSDDLFAMSERWLVSDGNPAETLRSALAGVAEVYVQHGGLLRAVADAATQDDEIDRVYQDLVQAFVTAVAGRIRRDELDGRTSGLDPQETARALVWMIERYLVETYGRTQTHPVDGVVDTLHAIWMRTLYGA